VFTCTRVCLQVSNRSLLLAPNDVAVAECSLVFLQKPTAVDTTSKFRVFCWTWRLVTLFTVPATGPLNEINSDLHVHCTFYSCLARVLVQCSVHWAVSSCTRVGFERRAMCVCVCVCVRACACVIVTSRAIRFSALTLLSQAAAYCRSDFVLHFERHSVCVQRNKLHVSGCFGRLIGTVVTVSSRKPV
jgi:hypothetical protein